MEVIRSRIVGAENYREIRHDGNGLYTESKHLMIRCPRTWSPEPSSCCGGKERHRNCLSSAREMGCKLMAAPTLPEPWNSLSYTTKNSMSNRPRSLFVQ